MKLHKILIIVTTISVIITGILLLVAEATDKGYIEFNETEELQMFMNASQRIKETVNDTQQDLMELQGDPSLLDILGSMVTGGFNAAKTSTNSYNAMFVIGSTSINMLPLGSMGPVFTDHLGLVLTILIFIGIILAVLLTKGEVI